ncbi:MFS transporter [Serratia sp. YC16]|uniref:MFS transporter n=1 Tax=Serratia sp. YC16 TaxID=2675312 RepID=UPI001E50F99C|nr:MFS transporter [Serratia sp. YC16]
MVLALRSNVTIFWLLIFSRETISDNGSIITCLSDAFTVENSRYLAIAVYLASPSGEVKALWVRRKPVYRLSRCPVRTIRKKVRTRKFSIRPGVTIVFFHDGDIMTSYRTNRSQVSLLAALTIALFFILLNSGSPTPLYPLYQQTFALSNIDLTFIFSSYGFGVLLALFLSRRLTITDNNARLLVVVSLLLVVVPTLCFSMARSLQALCLFRFISGLGAGTATAIINILLIKFSRGDSAKRAALLGSMALVTGLALGPVIGSVYAQLAFYPLTAPAMTVAALVLLSAIAIVLLWPKKGLPALGVADTKTAEKGAGFSQPLFYLLALCVFISWSYAALILSLGPTAAIHVFGLKSAADFGYIATGYLLVAGVVQFTIPRFLQPEFSLVLGLIAQVFSMVMMTMALESGSVAGAAVSLALSGFSYGAVFVGGAILVNKLSLAAPGWNAVSKFYFIVYLFNITPPAAGWLADNIGVLSALLAAIALFMAIYIAFAALALWALLLRKA